MSLPETTSFCEVETKKNSFHPQWITSCLLNKLEVFGSAGIPINLHPSPLCPSLHHPRAPNTPFSVFFFFFFEDESQKQQHIPHPKFFSALLPWPPTLRPPPSFSSTPHFSLLLTKSLLLPSYLDEGGGGGMTVLSTPQTFPYCSDEFPLFLLTFRGFKVVKNKTNLEESCLILFISPLNVSSDFDSVTLSFLCLSPSCLGRLWTGGCF